MYPLQLGVGVVDFLPVFVASGYMADLVPGENISIGSSSISASTSITSIFGGDSFAATLLVADLALQCQLQVHVASKLDTDIVFFAHSIKWPNFPSNSASSTPRVSTK